jgi:hypothetical protein
MQSVQCDCVACERREVILKAEKHIKENKDLAIETYCKTLNSLMEIKRKNGSELFRFTCTEETDSDLLTKELLKFYPERQLLEHENCTKMKKSIDKLGSPHLTFTKVYFSHLIPHFKNITSVDMWILCFRYDIDNCFPPSLFPKNSFDESVFISIKRYVEISSEFDSLKKRNTELEIENDNLRLMVCHYQNMPGGEQYEETKKHFTGMI